MCSTACKTMKTTMRSYRKDKITRPEGARIGYRQVSIENVMKIPTSLRMRSLRRLHGDHFTAPKHPLAIRRKAWPLGNPGLLSKPVFAMITKNVQ